MLIPNIIVPDLRTNHAGETGAVFIYKGILLVSKDKEIIEFAKNHLLTEKKHLELIETILPSSNFLPKTPSPKYTSNLPVSVSCKNMLLMYRLVILIQMLMYNLLLMYLLMNFE